jgi:hypothetical protein
MDQPQIQGLLRNQAKGSPNVHTRAFFKDDEHDGDSIVVVLGAFRYAFFADGQSLMLQVFDEFDGELLKSGRLGPISRNR